MAIPAPVRAGTTRLREAGPFYSDSNRRKTYSLPARSVRRELTLLVSCQRARHGATGSRKMIILGIDGLGPTCSPSSWPTARCQIHAACENGYLPAINDQHSAAESGSLVESDHGDERRRARDLRFHPPQPQDVSTCIFPTSKVEGPKHSCHIGELGHPSRQRVSGTIAARRGILGKFLTPTTCRISSIASRRISLRLTPKAKRSQAWERLTCAGPTAHSRSTPTIQLPQLAR